MSAKGRDLAMMTIGAKAHELPANMQAVSVSIASMLLSEEAEATPLTGVQDPHTQ